MRGTDSPIVICLTGPTDLYGPRGRAYGPTGLRAYGPGPWLMGPRPRFFFGTGLPAHGPGLRAKGPGPAGRAYWPTGPRFGLGAPQGQWAKPPKICLEISEPLRSSFQQVDITMEIHYYMRNPFSNGKQTHGFPPMGEMGYYSHSILKQIV